MLHFPADDADGILATALAAIHACCFDKPWSVTDFQTLLALPTTVAATESDGFLLAAWAADELEILTFCVLPAARRRGVGRRLLGEILDFAAAHDVKTAFLEVRADNVPAIALYRAAGFRDNGCRPGYYDTARGRIDALCLKYDF